MSGQQAGRLKIAVVAYLATYGNAPLLCHGLNDLGHDVRLIIRYRNIAKNGDYGIGDEFPTWQACVPAELAEARAWVKQADRVIVMAMPSLTWLLPKLTDDIKPGAIVLSSSHLLAASGPLKGDVEQSGMSPVDWNNRRIAASGLTVFAMPDLLPYVTCATPEPYYPPVREVDVLPKPDGPLVVAHSPGNLSRYDWKGTPQIAGVFDEINRDFAGQVECRVLPRMPHAELLEARKGHHVFVDQLHAASAVEGYPDYRGGLGKNGMEALAAGCVVLASGGPFPYTSSVVPPQVMWTQPGRLRQSLEYLVHNRGMIDGVGRHGAAWTSEYCQPSTVAARIMERIA